jgi:hypothetical protein
MATSAAALQLTRQLNRPSPLSHPDSFHPLAYPSIGTRGCVTSNKPVLTLLLLALSRAPHNTTRTELRKNPVEGFSAGLVDDDNIFEWEITIFG